MKLEWTEDTGEILVVQQRGQAHLPDLKRGN